MTILTALYSIVLRPLPYANADELVLIRAHHLARGETGATISQEALDAWRGARSLSELGTWREGARDLTGAESYPERVIAAAITPNLFAMLGVEPVHGRWFDQEEGEAGGSDVVILGHELWLTRFGGDEGVVGSEIELNGRSHLVTGIMPAGFSFPEGTRLWTPLVPPPLPPDILFYNGVLGRRAPGMSLEQARTEFEATMQGFHARHGYERWLFSMASLHEGLVGALRRPILIFQGAALLVLLLACANVAALLLARAVARRRELAVRAALGAAGSRLVGHVLVESLVLALLGGVIGIALASGGVRMLSLAFPDGVPSYIDLKLHPSVLAATVLVVMLSALAFGVGPAVRAGRIHAAGVLTGGRDGASGRLSDGHARGLLVAAEVAISVVLLSAAVLLVRTHVALERSLGFEPAGVLSVSVRLPVQHYAQPEQRVTFFSHLEERLRGLPHVTQVSASVSGVPLDRTMTSGLWQFRFDDQVSGTEHDEQLTTLHYVAPGYMDLWGVQFVEGRDVALEDVGSGEYTAVINETFARRYTPGGDALGRRIIIETSTSTHSDPARIVGVVRHLRHTPPPAEVPPTVYMLQPPGAPTQTFLLKTTLKDPAALASVIRDAVRELDPALIVHRIQAQETVVQRTFWQQSMQRNVIGAFAALALLLTVFGMYGVLSYAVGQRTSEFGVRLALGASPSRLLLLVFRQATGLAGTGIVAGAISSLAMNRLMASLLYGVDPADLLTLAAVAGALFVVALAAAVRPALRVARLEPQIAIRDG